MSDKKIKLLAIKDEDFMAHPQYFSLNEWRGKPGTMRVFTGQESVAGDTGIHFAILSHATDRPEHIGSYYHWATGVQRIPGVHEVGSKITASALHTVEPEKMADYFPNAEIKICKDADELAKEYRTLRAKVQSEKVHWQQMEKESQERFSEAHKGI